MYLSGNKKYIIQQITYSAVAAMALNNRDIFESHICSEVGENKA